jgi:hypothetical protein
MSIWKQALCGGVAALALGGAQQALADDQAATPAPAATPAAPAAPAANPMATPSMGPTLSANPDPFNFTLGPAGKIYVTGALTGMAMTQNNVTPGDHQSWADITNAQIFVQKTDGIFQFFVEAGDYSLPALGTAYVKSSSEVPNTFGVVPVAYGKLAPTSWFSIEAGKLPTLIGAEGIFTFENMNIERGLLWNQEPVVSNGVQLNFAKGAFSASISINSGLYSNKWNWISGLATWTINPRDSLTFSAGGYMSSNPFTGPFTYAGTVTPIPQNNSQIFDLIFTHSQGPFTITPYFQYTNVPAQPEIGLYSSASTVSGAILAKYSITPEISIAGRLEYISSSAGSPLCYIYNPPPPGDTVRAADTYCYPQTSLLYGPGSNAFSVTITPTYQYKVFFARAEFSYTTIGSSTEGYALGPQFSSSNQIRGMLETGILF